jgi:multiple sugar transport system substrate-binding protein
MTVLKGMTWSHPRGYDPLIAVSRAWRDRTGIEMVWDKRSLQGFESFPVEELARHYDLIVIDHPHVGQIVRERSLIPLDGPERSAELAQLARQSVGPSFESYRYSDRLWALPIDAAALVQAWRPDLMPQPIANWREMQELAHAGRVACPLRAPHSLMLFYLLAANLGYACATVGPGPLIPVVVGERVFDMIRDLAGLIDPQCLEMDPIAVYEWMSQTNSRITCAPYIFGYVNYARTGFREAAIAFADIPEIGIHGSVGSTLGGTGIAVSAHSTVADIAIDFAFWIASAQVQCSFYAAGGGQSGNAVAWENPAINESSDGFYFKTRATLNAAFLRPRHDGYMQFQNSASELITNALRNAAKSRSVVEELNLMFAASFRHAEVVGTP